MTKSNKQIANTKFKCSSCDIYKDSKTQKEKLWDMNQTIRVTVCKECWDRMKAVHCYSVKAYFKYQRQAKAL